MFSFIPLTAKSQAKNIRYSNFWASEIYRNPVTNKEKDIPNIHPTQTQ